MGNIVVRRNHQFVIDKTQLSKDAQKVNVVNALYGDLYAEFRGAIDNPKYQNMTNLKRYEAVNKFAADWLKQRGL